MSATLTPLLAVSGPPSPLSAFARAPRPWLIGPWFDLVFVANLAWPIVVLLSLVSDPLRDGPLSILQLYFLSTPHRWITLVLVFVDREHFWKQPGKFGGLAAGLITLGLSLAILGTYAVGAYPGARDSLFLLMMLDFVWNAWHFASQHAGISRIYGRMARPADTLQQMNFEKMAIRLLVLWTFFRVAIAAGERYADQLGEAAANLLSMTHWLNWITPLLVAPALVLVVREIINYQPQCRGRLAYILSVVVCYAGQLVAICLGDIGWMTALFLAGAVFHATEYLAIVSWSVRKKSTGAWRYLVPRWSLALVAFIAVLGVTGWLLERNNDPAWKATHPEWIYAWMLVTLLVSLLHYGYDGIIWKSKPKPAVPAAA
jgi:hypothetical protein